MHAPHDWNHFGYNFTDTFIKCYQKTPHQLKIKRLIGSPPTKKFLIESFQLFQLSSEPKESILISQVSVSKVIEATRNTISYLSLDFMRAISLPLIKKCFPLETRSIFHLPSLFVIKRLKVFDIVASGVEVKILLIRATILNFSRMLHLKF